MWALPLNVKGATLAPIPRDPPDELQVERSLIVDATEGVDIPALFRAEVIMRGDTARVVKAGWDALPESGREEGKRGFWREQYNNIELEKADVRFDDDRNILTLTASGTIRLEWDPEYNTYSPDAMDVGYRADFSRAAGTDAQAPYLVTFPLFTRSREVINLPPQQQAYTVLGKDINRTVAGMEYRRKASLRDFRFEAEVTRRSIAPEFPASEKAEAERVLLEMSRNDLYLKKPAKYLATLKELKVSAEKPLQSVDAYVQRAGQYQLHGMLAESATDFASALALDAKSEKALLGRGVLYMQMARPDAARADFRAALALDPESIDARHSLAMLAISQYDATEALETIAPVIDKNPASPERMVRVRVRVLQGQHAEALQEVEAVLEGNSRIADAWNFKAVELTELGRGAEVPAVAESMRRAFAENDPAQAVTGPVYMLTLANERARAREMMAGLLRDRPSTAYYLMRADVQETAAEAMADVRAAIKLDNGGLNSMMTGINLMTRHRWSREALELIDEMQKITGDHYVTLQLRAIALWQNGQKSEATPLFAKARAKSEDPMWLNNACWSKATLDMALDEALRDCDAALAKKPDCGPCKDSRALVLLRQGRFRESEQAYDALVRNDPGHAVSLFGRGIARLRMGQKETGEKDLRLAHAMQPTIGMVYRQYGVTP